MTRADLFHPRDMRTVRDTGEYMVETDGRTLWVNAAAMLGRFSPMGVSWLTTR